MIVLLGFRFSIVRRASYKKPTDFVLKKIKEYGWYKNLFKGGLSKKARIKRKNKINFSLSVMSAKKMKTKNGPNILKDCDASRK